MIYSVGLAGLYSQDTEIFRSLSGSSARQSRCHSLLSAGLGENSALVREESLRNLQVCASSQKLTLQ